MADSPDTPSAAIPDLSDNAESSDFVDVDEIIACTPLAEHKIRANHYFSWMGDDAPILKKPVNNIPEAIEALQAISLLLRFSRLFMGAKVMDFGAGTCWLSRDLALLGCDVTAVDISDRALALGKKFNERHPFAAQMSINYHAFDGENLDLPDESFDNIVCFSAFHHVAAETTLLKHFHRVLRPGGIAAFYESGPHHASTPASQMEMRQYGVIERGIDTDRIWRAAAEIGFADMKLAQFMPQPVLVSPTDFNEMLTGPTTVEFGPGFYNLRPFFLYKAGERALDSRSGQGLIAEITGLLTELPDGNFVGKLTIKNIGKALWLPSKLNKGGICLSSRLINAENKVVQPSYKSWWVIDREVAPGDSITVEIDIPAPPSPDLRLSIGLVAQRVAHFDGPGNARFLVSSP